MPESDCSFWFNLCYDVFLVSACCELFDELAPHAVNATTDAVASVAFTKDLNFIFFSFCYIVFTTQFFRRDTAIFCHHTDLPEVLVLTYELEPNI